MSCPVEGLQIRRFEIRVLRPTLVLTCVGIAWSAIRLRWPLLAAFIVGWVWLDRIGAAIHPLLSSRQLLRGPTRESEGMREYELLSEDLLASALEESVKGFA